MTHFLSVFIFILVVRNVFVSTILCILCRNCCRLLENFEIRSENMDKMGKARISHQRRSIKKGVLRNFTKFTGKHLCQSLFFNKVAGLRPANSLKKRPWQICFPVNFVKFPRTPLATASLKQTLDQWTNLYSKSSMKPVELCM